METINLAGPSLIEPIQNTEKTPNVLILRRQYEKLDQFLDIPLDEENREVKKLEILDELQGIDSNGILTIVTRTNLTKLEDLTALDEIINIGKNVDYFLLLFIAAKLEQEALLARVKNFFECSFLTPRHSPDLLNRSILLKNKVKFDALRKKCRDYLIDLFLTVSAPIDENQPSTSGTSEIKKGYFTEMMPSLISGLDLVQVMEKDSRLEVFNDLMELCKANATERQLFEILCRTKRWSDKRRKRKLKKLLKPRKQNLFAHELIILWLITEPNYRHILSEKIVKRVKKQLAIYFNQQFAYHVPESTKQCLINRSYYVQNREIIGMLSEKAQKFIQKCLITAPTKGHKSYMGLCNSAVGFSLKCSDKVKKILINKDSPAENVPVESKPEPDNEPV